MESKNIILILGEGKEVLYQYSLDQEEAAYHKAAELEEMGVEVTLHMPSLPESLGNSLGVLDQKSSDDLKRELDEEIKSHESCCTK